MAKEILYSEMVCLIQDNLVKAAANGSSYNILIELLSLLTPVLRQEALVMAAVTESDLAVKNLLFVMDMSDITAALEPLLSVPEYLEAAESITENLNLLLRTQTFIAYVFICAISHFINEDGQEEKDLGGDIEDMYSIY
ncbi:MAG: hypothetical protein H0U78_00950 [Rickettsiaceae bacterium]|jgi:hypothetical protein|nr:hypothetical protein [Rickettsiaceae bacterium]